MVGEMRGQVNERRGVGSLSIGYFLQNRHYTQNARNRDSECNGISTVVRLRLRARELHQLVGLRSGKRLRCEVFEGNSKQAILWCVLRTGLLGENQQSEGFRNHFRPGMRILGRCGRWRSEVGSHGIDVVVLGVEGHGSGTGLRRDCLDYGEFVGRVFHARR